MSRFDPHSWCDGDQPVQRHLDLELTVDFAARTLTGSEANTIVVVMTRTVSASGIDWGVLAAAGVLTILPGLAVVWFVRRHLVKGFALGRV